MPAPLPFPPACPLPQSQKVDKESGQALSCVNCYFMCQVRWGQVLPCLQDCAVWLWQASGRGEHYMQWGRREHAQQVVREAACPSPTYASSLTCCPCTRGPAAAGRLHVQGAGGVRTLLLPADQGKAVVGAGARVGASELPPPPPLLPLHCSQPGATGACCCGVPLPLLPLPLLRRWPRHLALLPAATQPLFCVPSFALRHPLPSAPAGRPGDGGGQLAAPQV